MLKNFLQNFYNLVYIIVTKILIKKPLLLSIFSFFSLYIVLFIFNLIVKIFY